MRHEQPDEADEPRGRDGAGGEQRRRDVHAGATRATSHTESGGGVLAEREHVDRAAQREQRPDADRDETRRAAPATTSRRRRSPSSTTARRARVVLRVRERDHDRRVGERADDDAGHEQDARVAAPAGGTRDEQRERDGASAPAKPATGTSAGGAWSATATTAPTAAPPETPSRYGSASGLRVAPAAPRPPRRVRRRRASRARRAAAAACARPRRS